MCQPCGLIYQRTSPLWLILCLKRLCLAPKLPFTYISTQELHLLTMPDIPLATLLRASFRGCHHPWNSPKRGPFYKHGSKYPIQFAFTQDFPGVKLNEIINDDYKTWLALLSQSVKRRENFCFSAHPSEVLIQADPLLFSGALNICAAIIMLGR